MCVIFYGVICILFTRGDYITRKILLPFFLSVLLFLIISSFLNYLSRPCGTVIASWDRSLPFYQKVEKPSRTFLQASFELPEHLLSSTEEIAMVFQKVIGNQLKVYLNGELIHVVGSESGNIWPSPIIVRLPKNILSNQNSIRLELFAVMNYGISHLPYVTTLSEAQKISWLQGMFRNDLNLFAMGIATIIAYIMFFIFGITNIPQRKEYLYLGFSSLFTIIGLFQFVFRETSGSVFLYMLFEKVSIALPALSATFIYLSINERYGKKIRKIFLNVLLCIPIIILWIIILPFENSAINVLSDVSNLYSLFLVGLTTWHVFRYKVIELVFPILFLLMTAIQSTTVLLSRLPDELLLPYGRIIFLVFVSMEAVRHFKNLSKRKDYLERENYIDQLTGAYNRKIIEKLDKNDGILVLLDLDGFKRMNDVYGHKKGDEILKEFSALVMKNIRSDDYFIRLGGDEFCIITKSTDIRNQITRLYNLAKNELNLGFSYGIVDLSEYKDFDKAYMKADENLYEHKWSRKNQTY